MKLVKTFLLTTISLMMISGCVQQPKEKIVYLPVPLELPSKKEVPKISSSSLSCLDESTKATLLKRDKTIKAYISELEAIILSTKK